LTRSPSRWRMTGVWARRWGTSAIALPSTPSSWSESLAEFARGEGRIAKRGWRRNTALFLLTIAPRIGGLRGAKEQRPRREGRADMLQIAMRATRGSIHRIGEQRPREGRVPEGTASNVGRWMRALATLLEVIARKADPDAVPSYREYRGFSRRWVGGVGRAHDCRPLDVLVPLPEALRWSASTPVRTGQSYRRSPSGSAWARRASIACGGRTGASRRSRRLNCCGVVRRREGSPPTYVKALWLRVLR
jgi:hypothetical protein